MMSFLGRRNKFLPLVPIDRFELLQKWETSKFASSSFGHAYRVDHVPEDIPIKTQREVFHPIMELQDWYTANCMPRLYFEGRTPNWGESERKFSVAGSIAGQYETPDGYLVIVADNSPALFRNNDAKLSWKMSIQNYADWKCVLGGKNLIAALYFDKELNPVHWVLLNAGWLISYPKSYGRDVPQGTMYMYRGIENIHCDGQTITADIFRQCQISISLSDNPKFRRAKGDDDDSGGFVRAYWTPLNDWFALHLSVTISNIRGTAPIDVRINSWPSIWRALKRRWNPKPRLEDFEVIDPQRGYLNYKADQQGEGD